MNPTLKQLRPTLPRVWEKRVDLPFPMMSAVHTHREKVQNALPSAADHTHLWFFPVVTVNESVDE